MTSLISEPRISLNALAERENVHPSTCWRWCLRGCRGHVLESFNVGGKKFTTLVAYERWLGKLNDEPLLNEATPQRQREIDQAERELAQIGA